MLNPDDPIAAARAWGRQRGRTVAVAMGLLAFEAHSWFGCEVQEMIRGINSRPDWERHPAARAYASIVGKEWPRGRST